MVLRLTVSLIAAAAFVVVRSLVSVTSTVFSIIIVSVGGSVTRTVFLRQRFPLVALLPERSFLQLQSVLELVSVPEQVLYRKRKIVGINPAIIIPIIRIPAFIPSHAMGITGVLCGDVPGIFDFVLCCLCSV